MNEDVEALAGVEKHWIRKAFRGKAFGAGMDGNLRRQGWPKPRSI